MHCFGRTYMYVEKKEAEKWKMTDYMYHSVELMRYQTQPVMFRTAQF